MFGVSPFQMLVVLAVVLLLFGNRLPSVMRNMGKSVTEFKKGVRDSETDESETPDEAKHVE